MKETPMNRLTMTGISATALAATAVGALALAAPAGAAPSVTRARTVVAAACHATHHNYRFPKHPETFAAWNAGSVTIAPAGRRTIRVAGVKPARGWRAYVDTRRGQSVDVYFRSGRHLVKFEAEVNDAGGLTITLSNCGR
jgi:hypothetical protein